MKVSLNWRKWVIYILLAIGVIAILSAAGQPSEQVSDMEWSVQFLISLAVAAGSFFTLGSLAKRWERDNKLNLH